MDKDAFNKIKKNMNYFLKKLKLKRNRSPVSFVLASLGIALSFLLMGTLWCLPYLITFGSK